MGYYIYQDEHEYWRWYLLGANHRRIAESSQLYDDAGGVLDRHRAREGLRERAGIPGVTGAVTQQNRPRTLSPACSLLCTPLLCR